MEQQSNKKQKWIIMLIIFLLISVTITTIIYFDCIRNYLPSDEGAIDILDTDNDNDNNDTNNDNDYSNQDEFIPNPDIQGLDDQGIWKKNVNVEIFRISYENGEAKVTVLSDRGDKVIAPGTENSYMFKLKNTGNVVLDYELDINAYVNRGDITIPVIARVNRYDGEWIVGGAEEWVDVPTLDSTTDKHTLGIGRFSWYTLDWKWPYESGDDDFDTYLGNLAVSEDITFTIVIETVATVNENPNYIGGVVPSTGDNSNTWLYASLAGGSMLILLILLYKRRDDEDE